MDFELTDEQKDIKKAAADFAEGELEDIAQECDREEKFPEEAWEKACDLGFVGSSIPEKYGGGGMGMTPTILIMEEFWRVDPGCGQLLASTFGSEMIMLHGNEDQMEKYLPPLCNGDAIMGAAITEPEMGTDVAGAQCRAVKEGDEYVINGNKQFITNGTIADYLVVFCLTNPDADSRHRRHSVLIVETDQDGFTADKLENKLGIRASPTAELAFNDVRVPEENLIGEEGYGFIYFMEFFNVTRIGVAAQAVGLAQGALDEAVEYAKERETFGSPLTEKQGIRWKLADMATKVEASRNLTYKAATQADEGNPDPGTVAMAKYMSGKTAVHCANEAVQIHGGYGYIDDYKVERLYRDAKILEIYEGTREAELMTVADWGLGI